MLELNKVYIKYIHKLLLLGRLKKIKYEEREETVEKQLCTVGHSAGHVRQETKERRLKT